MAYPTDLDNFTDPQSTDTLNVGSHSAIHRANNVAIEALEAKVGVTNSVVTTSHEYLIKNTSSSNPGHKHTLANGATDVTATASELNIMDGVSGVVVNDINGIPTGWTPATEAWTYDSVDEPNGVIRAAGDMTGRYSPGIRLKFQQDIALSAYWTFDTNSNGDVGGLNGSDANMSYTAGKFSNAATFNGTSSRIAFTDNSIFKPTTLWTIGCWLKTSTTGRVWFHSFRQNGSNFYGLYFAVNSNGVLALQIGYGGAGTYAVTGGKVITDGSFHYVVVTYRTGILQIYVDGVLDVAAPCAQPTYDASNTVRVGCENYAGGSDSSFWNGQIDDLFIINGNVLDESTIKARYAAQTAQGTGNVTVTKKGIVQSVGTYTGVYTPLTVFMGTDYILQNATISNPYWSRVRVPYDFPPEESKWRYAQANNTDDTQSSPTASTWYNPGSRSISMPIGAWKPLITGHFRCYIASGTDNNIYVSLSKFNNSESDTEMTSTGESTGATGDQRARVTMLPMRILKVATKTTWYLISKTTKSSTNSIDYRGTFVPTILELINAYL